MAYNPILPKGQATMAESNPVVIANNQSAVPVSATDLDIRNLTNTDVVTAELSATDNAVLDAIESDTTTIAGDTTSIDGKTPALGQALAAGSVPVVLTAAQITTLTPPAAITGFALETGGNLATIAGKDFATQTTLAALNTKFVSGTDIGDVDILSVTPGVGATNLGKAEDQAHVSGDVGVMVLAIRDDTCDVESGTEQDYEPLHTNATGALWSCLTAETTKVIGTVRVASGGIASGSIASGAIASGALAAGSIAVGAITAGNTSICTTEDTVSAAGEHIIKNGIVRYDTPVSGANVSGTADWMPPIADSFGKAWVTATVPEDTAHIDLEAITANGSRRIDTLATSAGSSGDWATQNQTAEGAAWATLAPTTTSGLSVANFTSGDTYTALTATAQVIKASAGNLYGYYIFNPNAATSYVMIYNIAAASVTVGTSTALMVFAIPAGSAANVNFPYPISFSNAGWSIAAATTGAGNTAPTTALEVMIYYK